ncbi:protein Dok-7-like isoform X2 [Echeneis naucrates]|uniref:protein Dok-7-like isoform X2 n=1 Tax=Echeneis naucrates TaxID=173247 RepID=UPI0011144825|nr:protein Dok-7-like isoform X2 [Echeneis naucrates]
MTDSVVVEGYARLRDGKKWKTRWLVLRKPSPVAVHRFSVGVLPGTKLESGPATLHLCNNLLALARDVPPVIIGHWNLPDLRRYGPVPNGFVFEGGTRCGFWAGVFLLASADSEQISFLFDCIVRGISPTRGPFGLRPVLPDPSTSQTSSEEKLNHEAQELEKRLSMLSHRSSTASSTYCPFAGGDDRSISGSSDASDTSQSDSSNGSRLAIWADPTSAPSESTGATVALQSIEKLPANQGAGSQPATKPPRQLQEIGRQSSSDSGIATGSHSSYSGSFSSYTGSLDITPGEDFGSVFSFSPHLAQDLSPCTCPTVPGHEYQVPTSLRYLYDTPRNLLQEGNVGGPDSKPPTPTKDTSAQPSHTIESAQGDKSSVLTREGHSETPERQSVAEQSQGPARGSKKKQVVPPSEHPDPCHICSSLTSVSKTIVTICTVCGGFKGTPSTSASGSVIAALPDKRINCKEERRRADAAYEIMEIRAAERSCEAEERSKYELMGSCGQQRFLQETEGAVFIFPPEAPLPERPGSDGVTYVNIPVSPTSKKQLNYMELELQEPGPGTRGAVTQLSAQRKSATKYAQIDITATETAHKVGTQHALGRQEGLHTLELRRKGTPH